jgi:cell wall assembly regulator SMI1
LGFKFPKEIYELYQWRNGTEEDAQTVVFPTMQFLPISRAIEYSQGCNEYIEEHIEDSQKFSSEEQEWYEICPLFTFIESNGIFCGITIVEYQEGKIPIVDIGDGEMARIIYESLTDMMLTFAECYETGAYYLNDEGFVYEDEDKVSQIFCKYNPSVKKTWF